MEFTSWKLPREIKGLQGYLECTITSSDSSAMYAKTGAVHDAECAGFKHLHSRM